MPYRIELVGVTCDTGLAVARGIWRKIRTGRSVPVPSQLRSHRLFAENFETFAGLVDSTTLYHTGPRLVQPCCWLPFQHVTLGQHTLQSICFMSLFHSHTQLSSCLSAYWCCVSRPGIECMPEALGMQIPSFVRSN